MTDLRMPTDPVELSAHPGPHVGPMRRAFGRSWLRLFGWTLESSVPECSKAVFVAAPHTSNWDLPFTLAVAWSMDMHISWAGKQSIFRPPFGGFMKALGGVPIDRSKRANQVERMAQALKDRERLYLVIAPAGTRSRRDHWKSGFYRIAIEADVPILLAYLDYGKKKAGIGPVFRPTGNLAADMDVIRAFYADKRGHHPERESVVRLREESGEEPT